MSDHFDPYHVWLGIPPEESAAGRPNHYRLLGLRLFETNADATTVAAYAGYDAGSRRAQTTSNATASRIQRTWSPVPTRLPSSNPRVARSRVESGLANDPFSWSLVCTEYGRNGSE